MIDFYFVRHGKSVVNETGFVAGWTDVELSGVGEEQARDIAEVVRGRNFENLLIISSPLKRALKTAQIIADLAGYKGEIVELGSLKEKSAGELEVTAKIEDIFEKTEEEMIQHGGESAEMFRTRIRGAVEEVKKLAKGYDSVVIVAHAGVYKMLQTISDDSADATEMYRKKSPPNATLIGLGEFF